MSRTWSFCTFRSSLKFQPVGSENISRDFEKEVGSNTQRSRRTLWYGELRTKPNNYAVFECLHLLVPTRERVTTP